MGQKADVYRGAAHRLFEGRITAEELIAQARAVRKEQLKLIFETREAQNAEGDRHERH